MSTYDETDSKHCDDSISRQDGDLIAAVENMNVSQGNGEEDDEFQECSDGFVYEKDLQKAIAAKEEGNNFFRNKDYDEALEAYSRAITYCPEDDKENLATFYGNRSAAYSSLEEWELVVEDCTAAIALKPDYVKVLARRMLANEKMEKYEEALAGESSTDRVPLSVVIFQMLSFLRANCVSFLMFCRRKIGTRQRSILPKDKR